MPVKQGKKRNNMREGEWKSITDKPEPKLETRNNLPNPKSIHGGKKLSKPGVANIAKGRATRDASSDEN
ncbi:hypothetical protein DY000_02005308 [Brassica cretica]|uniref:Uncharacterized protein n=1 Tax=Brassica cretica TaxID=69181 RepID=A0ABQ7CGA6_BRACR|nr:hypothetical protein DY000_02005308 [Brassica cretica]